MSEEHKTNYQDNIPAYALGALDNREARHLEEHLKSCLACQAELTKYQSVSTNLLSALPPQVPPSSIRKNLMKQLENNPKRTVKSSFFSSIHFSFRRTAPALAAIFLLGLNIILFLQIRVLQQEQAHLLQHLEAEQEAIALLVAPETQIIPSVENGAGSLLFNSTTNTAILITRNLPELPDDKVFQIWLINEQEDRISAGLFESQNDTNYTLIEMNGVNLIEDYVALGITIEPAGGSPGPTGSNVFKMKF